MSPTRSTIVIALMAVMIAVLFWALVYYARDELQLGAGAPEDEIPAASAVSSQDGFPVVTVSPESQKASGIETAALTEANSEAAVEVYGAIIDPQPLIDQRARLLSALSDARVVSAAAANSKAEYQRARKLYEDERNLSLRALLAAEAQFKVDQARLQAAEQVAQSARDGLRASFGPIIAGWASGKSPRFEAVASQRELIVQMTFPFDLQDAAGKRPLAVAPLSARTALRPARFVSASPQTDATLPGATFFYVVPGQGLRVGMRVAGELKVDGESRGGVVIPSDAVVWHGGKAWAYVKADGDRFLRKPVATSEEMGNGWFTAEGFAPGDEVVVSGAQLLLSEELKYQIRNENED